MLPLLHLVQDNAQPRSILIHIRLFRPLQCKGKMVLLLSFPSHPAQNMTALSTALVTQALKSASSYSPATAQAGLSVCSHLLQLSYYVFPKNSFLGSLWRSFKSSTFSVVVIFLLLCLLKGQGICWASTSTYIKEFGCVRARRRKLQNVALIFFSPEFTGLCLLAQSHKRKSCTRYLNRKEDTT